MQICTGSDRKRIPWIRAVAGLALLLALVSAAACNPNPQPRGLTPVPTLAAAATLTLVPSTGGTPASGGETGPTAAPGGEGGAPTAGAVAEGDPEAGATIFTQNCMVCHGENAAGGTVGPSLVRPEVAAQDDAFYHDVIAHGRPGTAMPAWEGRLNEQQISDVIAYIRSLQ